MFTLHRFYTALFTTVSLVLLTACGNSEDEPQPAPVPVIDTAATFQGETITYPVDNPSDIYTSTSGTYKFSIDEKTQTATLMIENADFLQGMPRLDVMSFPGLTYKIGTTASSTKLITFESAALTPEIANRPFPAFPISDLNATMAPGKSLDVDFICTYRGTPYQVTFTGTPIES